MADTSDEKTAALVALFNQSMFYLMSVHIEVLLFLPCWSEEKKNESRCITIREIMTPKTRRKIRIIFFFCFIYVFI